MSRRLVVITLFASLLGACDKIKEPKQYTGEEVSKRKVLLEDYTGHQCGNCPAAAEVAEKLAKQYEGRLIVVSVHAGYFAETDAQFPNNYETTAGPVWFTKFVGNAGNPNGLVNRKNYASNGLVHNHSKWPTTVNLGFKDIHFLDMSITPSFNATTRNLTATVKAKFARRYAENTSLSLVLIEDSIIGPQLDYRKKPDKVPNFVFMHMLRDEINGTWGTPLKSAPIAYNDSVSVTFSNYTVKPEFKAKNLYLVGFVFNSSNNEVLQAEKVKLIPAE